MTAPAGRAPGRSQAGPRPLGGPADVPDGRGADMKPLLSVQDLHAHYGKSPSYVYYFAHRPTEPVTPCGYGCGAGHGAEIQYVFDHLGQDARPWSAYDRQLANRMADTWANFARTGDPNGTGLPAWPAFDGTNASIMRIGDAADLEARGRLPDFSLFGSPPGK